MTTSETINNPSRHHLDRRAPGLIGLCPDGNDDALLDTRAVASWLGVSEQWLETGRCNGYGPRFQKNSPRRVRYRKGDVLAWLRSRNHASTAEYRK